MMDGDEQAAANSPNASVESDAVIDVPEKDVAALQAETDKFRDLAYRAAAELENYRRRAAREREENTAAVKERFVSRMIPVLDAFDLAEAAVDAGATDDVRKKYLDGFLAIGRQLSATLESMGLSVVDIPANAAFDPGEQEAVLTENVAGLKTPMVLEVLQKGYKLDGRLIRPVRVKVGMENERGETS